MNEIVLYEISICSNLSQVWIAKIKENAESIS